MAESTTGDPVKVEVGPEKVTTKQDIKEFLGLQNTAPLAELQQRLGFTISLVPWWLDTREVQMPRGGKVHGPYDPT